LHRGQDCGGFEVEVDVAFEGGQPGATAVRPLLPLTERPGGAVQMPPAPSQLWPAMPVLRPGDAPPQWEF